MPFAISKQDTVDLITYRLEDKLSTLLFEETVKLIGVSSTSKERYLAEVVDGKIYKLLDDEINSICKKKNIKKDKNLLEALKNIKAEAIDFLSQEHDLLSLIPPDSAFFQYYFILHYKSISKNFLAESKYCTQRDRLLANRAWGMIESGLADQFNIGEDMMTPPDWRGFVLLLLWLSPLLEIIILKNRGESFGWEVLSENIEGKIISGAMLIAFSYALSSWCQKNLSTKIANPQFKQDLADKIAMALHIAEERKKPKKEIELATNDRHTKAAGITLAIQTSGNVPHQKIKTRPQQNAASVSSTAEMQETLATSSLVLLQRHRDSSPTMPLWIDPKAIASFVKSTHHASLETQFRNMAERGIIVPEKGEAENGIKVSFASNGNTFYLKAKMKLAGRQERLHCTVIPDQEGHNVLTPTELKVTKKAEQRALKRR